MASIVDTVTGKLIYDQNSQIDLRVFYETGRKQAEKLRPYLNKKYRVLEYGGGVGRLGRYLVRHCKELISVDVKPIMKEYGQIFCPKIRFLNLNELPEKQRFDICYSVAVFFHLNPQEQDAALQYIHQRLKPGGFALIDLILGPQEIPRDRHSPMVTSEKSRFLDQCEKYFTFRFIKLFNNGLLLQKQL